MKKAVSILLSLMMTLSLFPAAFVMPESAAEDMDSIDRWNAALDSVPNDPFEGDYTEKENPDGSKTYVFTNGSVATEYPDGSQEGVDFKGNKHYKDKDENITITFPDGSVSTDYADGKKSYAEPDGKTTYINPDMSTYDTYKNTGIIKEYDSNGNLTGVGFVGGDERLKTDEYGEILPGKISGPDGKTLEIKNDGKTFEAHLDYGSGKKLDLTESWSFENTTRTVSISGSDEVNGTWTEVTKFDNGMKNVETSGDLTNKDGDKLEFTQNFTYDKDGEAVYSKNNVMQVTTADGKTLRADKSSQAWEYNDPNSGEKVIVDKDGNAVEFNLGGNEFKAEYDENGNPKTVHWKTDTGAILTLADGAASVTLPDGTKYEADGNGNVWKDGVQIQKDDEWVEGYGPAKDTGKADDKSDDSKPEEPAADTGYTGGYYGTYDYTAYWDGGKQKQGNRGYYVYEYNGCYYLVEAKEPDDVKARIQEEGVEGFFHAYYNDRLTVENASFDPATRTATYLEKSYMNDVQYISTVYTIVFDGKGSVTISWESQNVYKGQSEPQESGTFTGKKK